MKSGRHAPQWAKRRTAGRLTAPAPTLEPQKTSRRSGSWTFPPRTRLRRPWGWKPRSRGPARSRPDETSRADARSHDVHRWILHLAPCTSGQKWAAWRSVFAARCRSRSDGQRGQNVSCIAPRSGASAAVGGPLAAGCAYGTENASCSVESNRANSPTRE
eukprot:scaffold1557_cov246-Pinguiococcus_pyrenoidosus.AAC.11